MIKKGGEIKYEDKRDMYIHREQSKKGMYKNRTEKKVINRLQYKNCQEEHSENAPECL